MSLLDELRAREAELANVMQQGMAELNMVNGRLAEVKDSIKKAESSVETAVSNVESAVTSVEAAV